MSRKRGRRSDDGVLNCTGDNDTGDGADEKVSSASKRWRRQEGAGRGTKYWIMTVESKNGAWGQKNVGHHGDLERFRENVRHEFGLASADFVLTRKGNTQPLDQDIWETVEDRTTIVLDATPEIMQQQQQQRRASAKLFRFLDGAEEIEVQPDEIPPNWRGEGTMEVDFSKACFGWINELEKLDRDGYFELHSFEISELKRDYPFWYRNFFQPLAKARAVVRIEVRWRTSKARGMGKSERCSSHTISCIAQIQLSDSSDHPTNRVDNPKKPVLKFFVPVMELDLEEEARRIFLQPLLNRKIRVVLDLDNTLISPAFVDTNEEPFMKMISKHRFRCYDLSEFEGKIVCRPKLKEFLNGLTDIAEVTIVSAGKPKYVNSVCKKLDELASHSQSVQSQSIFESVNSVRSTSDIELEEKVKDVRRYFPYFKVPGEEEDKEYRSMLV